MLRPRLRTLFFLLFGLFLTFAARAQESNPAPTPDISREAVVVEKNDTDIRFENDGTGERTQSGRIHVLSDTGVRQFGILTFNYQSAFESVDIDYVRVLKPDGTIVSTPLNNIQDMPSNITQQAPFYSDLHEKHIAVKALSAGDTIELQVHWHVTKALAPGQFWYAYNFDDDTIALEEQLRINVPAGRAIKWKSKDLTPTVEEKDGRKILTWKSKNLARKTPAAKEVDDEKQVYQAARGQLAPPDVELSSFQSWDELGRWYGSLQTDRVQPTSEIQQKAAELTKGLTTDDAKIQAIYRYVSEQFRYIGVAFGIGRYQPHFAAEVLDNQYGDCKDKHTLLASLLQAAGFTAYPALISTSRSMDLDVPSPAQFDHVISVVPQGNNFLWMDTTAEIAPAGMLVPKLRDKLVLIVWSNKPPAFVRTAADSPVPNDETFSVEGTLNDAGVVDAHMEEQAHGDNELVMRAIFRRVSEAEWNQLVQNISYGLGFGGTVSDVVATQPDALDVPFDLKYNYHRIDYSDWEHHQITLPYPPMGLPPLKADQTELAAPIWLGSRGEFKHVASLTIPKNYSVKLPADVQLKTAFAEYYSTYSIKDNVIHGERRLVIKEHEVPVPEFLQYKNFTKAIGEDLNKYIQFTPSGSAGVNPANPWESVGAQMQALPNSDNPAVRSAEQRASSAAMSQNMPALIAALNDEVAADPKYTRAWISLGEIYLSTGRQDEGLEALRKAADSAPELAFPSKMLAYGLMRTHKTDAAIETWQRIQKISPDDQDVANNLGMLFMQQKRYTDAIPIFEAAIKRNPNDAVPLTQLGFAYLRAGTPDKGLALLQSALKLRSDSVMENDIAYDLAQANVALPQALEYSQKSVQEEEQGSQKIKLENLQSDDLSHTPKLGSFWDTLGWIYFRMGSMEKAEGYLRAAFELTQSATVADHLGQVYEQEHKSASAIKMYRIALLLSHNSDEIQQHLDHLTHTHSKSDTKNGPYVPSDRYNLQDTLNDLWTVRLPRIVSGEANAEFFVLLAPGGKTQGVRFVSGAEQLKKADKTLSMVNFKAFFPPESHALLLRRGILACYKETGCSFTELSPSLVRSVN